MERRNRRTVPPLAVLTIHIGPEDPVLPAVLPGSEREVVFVARLVVVAQQLDDLDLVVLAGQAEEGLAPLVPRLR